MILIACDKFKGTLSAAEAGDAICRALRDGGYKGEISVVPMADGGEGTTAALGAEPDSALPGIFVLPGGDVAVVESSDFVGRPCFGTQDILDRSGFRLGMAVRAVRASGRFKSILIGIGGTAIADGGMGLLQGLGAEFRDAGGNLIAAPVTPRIILEDVASMSFPDIKDWRKILCGLSDVRASLVGPGLSAMDFVRQKGADDGEAIIIRDALAKLREIFPGHSSDFDGAGGGLGFAIASVLGAPCVSGADYVLSHLDMDLSKVELIITGEGSVDRQTTGGKVVDAVNRFGILHGIHVLSIGGMVVENPGYQDLVSTMSPGELLPVNAVEAARRLEETVRNRVFSKKCVKIF